MRLPLILGQGDADYQVNNVTYEFVMRGNDSVPLYEHYKNSIAIVIFRRVSTTGVVLNYIVHVYDIRENRQGILLLKQPLDIPLEAVSQQYLKLDLEEINTYTVRLFLFLNSTHYVTADIKYRN